MSNSIYIDSTMRSFYKSCEKVEKKSTGSAYLDMLQSFVNKTKSTEEKNIQEMSMDEYKSYIAGVLNDLPMHSTRENSTAAVIISNAGWERMKDDPAYEAWVIDQVADDFRSEDPWYDLGSNSCTIYRFTDNENSYRKDEWGKDFPGDIKTYLQYEFMNIRKTNGSGNFFMKIAKKRLQQNNQASLNDLAGNIATLQNLELLNKNKNSLFLANAQNALFLMSALNNVTI
ncbi:MAG: hypothetical protein IKN43_00830 [Selenomonadaceae bacterium]|nr:hypothetical protein [Selenomonadaceae bacterium]